MNPKILTKKLFLTLMMAMLLLSACDVLLAEEVTEVPSGDSIEPLSGESAPPLTSGEDANAPTSESVSDQGEWTHAPAFLDVTELDKDGNLNGDVILHLEGTLPTPCHQFQADVSDVDAQNQIRVEVYSLVQTGQICQEMLTPFVEDVSLGQFTEGSYNVIVNDEEIGTFDAASIRETGSKGNLQRGVIFIDSVSLSPPGGGSQAAVTVQGTLPDPCHQFQADVSAPNSGNEIYVDVYSLFDPDEGCIQVIQDFMEDVPLGTSSPGTYSVWVNGAEIGDVDVP